jgi:hypothetical protein
MVTSAERRHAKSRRLLERKAVTAVNGELREEHLTDEEALFVEAYLGNGGNATRAYRTVRPQVKNGSAGTEGWRMLQLPQVQAALQARRQEWFTRLEMGGDEALALIALRARADIGEFFDEKGNPLPIPRLPAALRLAIKSWKPDGTVVLYDALKAAELMAMATGRLRSTVNLVHNFDHARYLAGLDTPAGPEAPPAAPARESPHLAPGPDPGDRGEPGPTG